MSSPSASTAGRLRRWRVPVLLVVMLVVMALAQALTVALNDLGAMDLVAAAWSSVSPRNASAAGRRW